MSSFRRPDPVEVVKYLLVRWVDYPDNIEVKSVEREREIRVFLKVDPRDYPKVVGRNRRVLDALKSILSTLGAKLNRKVTLSLKR